MLLPPPHAWERGTLRDSLRAAAKYTTFEEVVIDYEQSPIFPQGQQSERNASARENHPTREIPEEKWGTTRSLRLLGKIQCGNLTEITQKGRSTQGPVFDKMYGAKSQTLAEYFYVKLY